MFMIINHSHFIADSTHHFIKHQIPLQARKAAEGAADKLKLRKPNSQMGFLRQKADGTTSLSFLTGGDGVIPGTERDRPVTLGSLIGKVSSHESLASLAR